MRTQSPRIAPLFVRSRVVHLARALLVSLLTLALTSLLLTTPRVPFAPPLPYITAQAA